MHDVVRCAINTADPMGLLKLGAPKDEYEPEIQDIVKVLASRPVNGVRDVQAALIDVFTQYFGRTVLDHPRRTSSRLNTFGAAQPFRLSIRARSNTTDSTASSPR